MVFVRDQGLPNRPFVGGRRRVEFIAGTDRALRSPSRADAVATPRRTAEPHDRHRNPSIRSLSALQTAVTSSRIETSPIGELRGIAHLWIGTSRF